jgi:pilus assembly protein Flp/PilA
MMTSISGRVHRALRAERGASLVEYALLMAMIAITTLAAVNATGHEVSTTFNSIAGAI